jgi:hypothetical protein
MFTKAKDSAYIFKKTRWTKKLDKDKFILFKDSQTSAAQGGVFGRLRQDDY